MAYRVDLVTATLCITCDYETPQFHSFDVNLTEAGPVECPICHRRYTIFGGYTVEEKGVNPDPDIADGV